MQQQARPEKARLVEEAVRECRAQHQGFGRPGLGEPAGFCPACVAKVQGLFALAAPAEPTFRIGLGDLVRDKVVPDYEGIVMARSEHLFGCARYWVQPRQAQAGKIIEGSWHDEDSVEVLQPAAVVPQRYRVVEAPLAVAAIDRAEAAFQKAGAVDLPAPSHGRIGGR